MAERGRGSPRILARLLLVALGCLLALAVLEVLLRVSGPLLRDMRGGERGRVTILCVGDSHTYGLHVPAGFDYPSRLQGELDPTATRIGVLNYGVPGRNSGALLREIDRYLETATPEHVLILIGFNDSWNRDAADADDGGPGLFDLRVLRLVRLIRLNLEGADDGGPRVRHQDGRVVVVDGGVERPAAIGGPALGILQGEELERQVTRNLEAIVARVRAFDANPVRLTYATENQPYFIRANRAARDVAGRLDVALIDTAAALRREIEARGYDALFFDDDHPNATGNELFARAVARGLIDLGLVERFAGAETSTREAAPRLAVRSRGDRVVFECRAGAHKNVHVFLTSNPGTGIPGAGATGPADPLVQLSLESPNLRGRTDASGLVALEIERSFLGAARGDLYAIAVVFPPRGDPIPSVPVPIPPRTP